METEGVQACMSLMLTAGCIKMGWRMLKTMKNYEECRVRAALCNANAKGNHTA